MVTILQQDADTCLISKEELIELLMFKVDSLKHAKEEDSSWNYPIEETKAQIQELKSSHSKA